MRKFENFESAIEYLNENNNYVSDRELLIQYVKQQIDEDRIFLAVHILKALDESDAEYFEYDYSAGTLENPTPLEKLEDLQDLIANTIE